MVKSMKLDILGAESKIRKLAFVQALAALLICSKVHAIENFNCTVQSYYHLKKNGEVAEHKFAKDMKGNKFFVYRNTGIIDGSTTNTGINTLPKVLLEGKGKQPFVAVTIDAKGRYVYQLHIAGWAKGSQKPFIFYRGDDMMSGICTVTKSEYFDVGE